jgi:myo-inositol-1(or 4)-monophosphatase
MPEFRRETHQAIAAVSRALALAEARGGANDINFKEGRDVVTATDVAVEDSIRESLRALRVPVIGEERGGEAPNDGSPYWLVDPICGTRNFASGLQLYCVNLALIEGNEVTAAVVGDPSRHEQLIAEHGGGAWVLNDGEHLKLSVSDASRTVVVEEGKAVGERRVHASRFMAAVVAQDRWDFRSLGTTLTCPYLAAGRVSAYIVFYVPSLHAAAGSLLATEAGAWLTDITGEPWTLDSDSLICAATPALHTGMLELARSTA